jgi:hypothetical protein
MRQDTSGRPIFDFAFVFTSVEDHFVRPEMISLLLYLEGNLNKCFNGSTLWQKCLSYSIIPPPQLLSAEKRKSYPPSVERDRNCTAGKLSSSKHGMSRLDRI